MEKFNKNIVVTEKEWSRRLKERWQVELASWKREGYEAPIDEEFYKTGNLDAYLNSAEATKTLASWGWVLTCNPSRNFEHLLGNIKCYWDWVLLEPDKRLPNRLDGFTRMDPQDYFEAPMSRVGFEASPVLDPTCSAKLFLMAFGENFESERVFPMAFGPNNWRPIMKAEPEQKCLPIMQALESYLFGTSFQIANRQCVTLLDYWFSTVPLLKDMRIYDTTLHVDVSFPDRTMLYQKQKLVRTLLAGLNGYMVRRDRGDTLTHNDLELEEYVRQRLAALDMPPEYHRLVDFVNEHKENCLDPFDEL